eukprot:1030386_1
MGCCSTRNKRPSQSRKEASTGVHVVVEEASPSLKHTVAVSSLPNPAPDADHLEIHSWLHNDVKLPEYYSVFVDNGFDNLSFIMDITDADDLTNIGISKIGHQKRILKQIQAKNIPTVHPSMPHNDLNQLGYGDTNAIELKLQDIVLNIAPKPENNRFDCDNESIEKCASVRRMLSFMKIYEECMDEQQDNAALHYDIFVASLNEYAVMDTINDYHHYKAKHDDPYNFYYVLESLADATRNKDCKRSHEMEIENLESILSNPDVNRMSTQNTMKLQILSAMHLEFRHTDTGSKVHNKENNAPIYERVSSKPVDDGNKVPFKLAMPQSKSRYNHQKSASKFVTELVLKSSNLNVNDDSRRRSRHNTFESSMAYDDFDSSEDEEEDPNDDDMLPSYCFGFKEELLQNEIYSMDEQGDWNAVYSKAKVYRNCIRAKALKASGSLLYFYYGSDHNGDPIEVSHIMALLFYCNYDNLQGRCSETFRIVASDTEHKKESGTSVWRQVKKRNAEFAHWSRLLREAVELYGIAMKERPGIKLYHGLKCELVFDCINCKFCAPTSMTTSWSVAQSFSQGFGLILALTMYDSDLRFFDVSWLSNYPTEEERLFIGGNGFIQLSNVILVRLGHNYEHYISAIGLIQNMFDARHNPQKEIHSKVINAVTSLLHSKIKQYESNRLPVMQMQLGVDNVLSHVKLETSNSVYLMRVADIPLYIQQLFDYFCQNWDRTITIDVAKFASKQGDYKIFKDLIIDKKHLKIDTIC